MTQFWPSLKSSGRSTMTESFKFWRHQWNKHGTCARNASHHSEYSMQDYFQITIELYRQFPIDRMLRSSGIVPSNDKAYDRTQFDKALQSNKFQANIFQLKCSIKDGPIGILSEIQVCLDRQLNPINCKYLFELEQESTETTDNIGCGNRIVLLEY
ncbi:hypothetical protein RDWZM_009325 [Blomia tropicalis]|uniref:Uncharacterized protein n=1 Tax=Blomia tropicalis TaxID=40697 RepID=A0A9Q0RJM2_BLOTA|nr:hypothetical protein RDWZM_009325 [Blomia tropicalis]